jgi:hypothetical protein
VLLDRDGFKPQRGGLFIVTNAPRSFFLFFGGAAFANMIPFRIPTSKHACAQKRSSRRAAEKQKEKVRFAFYYIQATPLGFLLQANAGKYYVIPSKM